MPGRVPTSRHRSRRAFAATAVLGGVLFLLTAGSAVPATSAAGTPLARDAARAEVHRLINGERAAAGLKPLTIDLLLASRAHDSSFACPGGGSTPGRARDIALANGLSHELSGCPGHTIVDVMPAWGYRGWTGEILAYNYAPSGMVTYRYGCVPGTVDFDCASGGTTTVASATAATAVRQWIDSPLHHSIMLGDYDRFGCGAWSGTGSTEYGDGGSFYACLFAKGGPSSRVDSRRPTVGAVTVDGAVLAAASDANARAGASIRLTARLADADALGRVAGWRVAVDGLDVVDEQGSGRVDWGRGTVQVSTALDTSGLAAGTHVVTIRSQDLAGRWSATRTISLVLAP
jgi:uncharacterized protein YkwD